MTESTENKRKRLLFRSWHRGTRELDLILGTFAERHLADFTDAELDQYDEILTYPDPDIYNWITRLEPAPANFINPVLERLIGYKIS